MKKHKPPPPPQDCTIIVVKKEQQWELLHWNRMLGHSKIGPRLARKDPLPNLPTSASTRMEAMDLADQWQAWLEDRPKRKLKTI